MRTLNVVFLVGAVLALAAPITPAQTIDGVIVPTTAQVAGHKLILNGAGTRTKFFFTIYVGALYLPKPEHTAAAVLAESGPRRVLMHFVFYRVSRKQLVDAWNDGFKSNTSKAERIALGKRIDAFDALFGAAPKGQRVLLDYVPGIGTKVSVDGKLRGTIAGKDFNDALMRIWLGDHPATRSLKRALLGK